MWQKSSKCLFTSSKPETLLVWCSGSAEVKKKMKVQKVRFTIISGSDKYKH